MIKENLFVLKQASPLGGLLVKPAAKGLARQWWRNAIIPINGTSAALERLTSAPSALMNQADASALRFAGAWKT